MTFERDPESKSLANNLLGEIQFKLDSDQVIHRRTAYEFSDWLGDVGGVVALLLVMAGFVLAGYSAFHAKVEILNSLYF